MSIPTGWTQIKFRRFQILWCFCVRNVREIDSENARREQKKTRNVFVQHFSFALTENRDYYLLRIVNANLYILKKKKRSLKERACAYFYVDNFHQKVKWKPKKEKNYEIFLNFFVFVLLHKLWIKKKTLNIVELYLDSIQLADECEWKLHNI